MEVQVSPRLKKKTQVWIKCITITITIFNKFNIIPLREEDVFKLSRFEVFACVVSIGTSVSALSAAIKEVRQNFQCKWYNSKYIIYLQT